jgi:hypothetical protein
MYECQSEQCKDDKEEVDKENSSQDIADSPEETLEHRIQEDRDKFIEVEEEYTPQRPEEQKVVCTIKEEDKCTIKVISYTFATKNDELSEDGETRQAKDEVMDLYFHISFNEHE